MRQQQHNGMPGTLRRWGCIAAGALVVGLLPTLAMVPASPVSAATGDWPVTPALDLGAVEVGAVSAPEEVVVTDALATRQPRSLTGGAVSGSFNVTTDCSATTTTEPELVDIPPIHLVTTTTTEPELVDIPPIHLVTTTTTEPIVVEWAGESQEIGFSQTDRVEQVGQVDPCTTTPPTQVPTPSNTEAPPASAAPLPADDEPDVQADELPCVGGVVDRYYTIAMDEVLDRFWRPAGLDVGGHLCGGQPSYFIYEGQPDPVHGSVVLGSDGMGGIDLGGFKYTPVAGFTGLDSFGFELREFGDTDVVDQATAYITVTDSCSVLAVEDSFNVPYEAGISVDPPGLLDNDTVECHQHTVAVSDPPTNGVLTVNGDGGFSYAPDDGFYGEDSFTYEIRDDKNQVLANSEATMQVLPPPCVAADDAFTTPAETTLMADAPGVLVNDFVCPDFYGLAVSQAPVNGDVTLAADGGFEYVPDQGFVGQDIFTYDVLDDNYLDHTQATATVLVDVTCSVSLVDDAYEAAAETEVHVAAPGPGANDTLCDPPAELQVVDSPVNGSVTLLGSGDMTYTPNDEFVGTDTFTYTVAAPAQPFTVSGFDRPAGVPEPLATVTINVSETPPTTTTTTTTTTVGPDTTGPPVDTTPSGTDGEPAEPPSTAGSTDGVRVATFNASLNRAAAGGLMTDLSAGDPQAAAVAEIIQRSRPDIVLLNEFDFDEGGTAVDLFRNDYLAVSQNGADPIDYPYSFTAPVNTGVESGFDLNHDGTVGGPDDAFGFGEFPGQYGMVVLSRYPIVEDQVRTFQNLLWATMPGARLPDDPATPEPGDWYSPQDLEVLRLSSKSHWDVPIDVDGRIVHVLAAHPTPPVFDGEEDRNGLRNADEIAFWADYVAGTDTSWIVDDAGTSGGLAADTEFVILGDLNTDPVDGDTLSGATNQLLGLTGVQDPLPASEGAVEAAQTQALANMSQQNDPANDTADFADDPGPGNLRADYVLPSDGFEIVDAGVFWPPASDPLSGLVATDPMASSDHRLVWVDLA